MIIARAALEGIRRALESTYPFEGCGFLVGSVGEEIRVVQQRPVRNDRAGGRSATNRYLISPEDFLIATGEAEAAELDIVGVYHSHPDMPPRPSAYDQEHAWPWYQYLIVSVVAGAAGDMRLWQLSEDRNGFVEQAICVEEDILRRENNGE